MAGRSWAWFFVRILGAAPAARASLVGLGIKLAADTVWTMFKDAGIEPAPRRFHTSWREFLRQQAANIVECDFLAVDTLFLERFYILFFIELESRAFV